MAKDKFPVTPAVREMRKHKADYEPILYEYVEKGGVRHSSSELGADPHTVIKTIILEDENKNPMVVLMHGDKEISTKNLARQTGAKSINPCEPERANKHTGYLVGGTSPFGTKKQMPVYVQKTIFDLDKIYINGGKRGFLFRISPEVISKILKTTEVDAMY